jgi:hypothetical protein
MLQQPFEPSESFSQCYGSHSELPKASRSATATIRNLRKASRNATAQKWDKLGYKSMITINKLKKIKKNYYHIQLFM